MSRRSDGRYALACVREDGSRTWQRDPGAFFPVHDLTHYAVESVLRLSRAFYGLVAGGWDLDDFGSPWPRGRLPVEAVQAELLVGLFDMERAAGRRLTADEFNQWVGEKWRTECTPGEPVRLTEETLAAIRERLADLMRRWQAVPPGATLTLEFPPS
jgi:hypothetical protein